METGLDTFESQGPESMEKDDVEDTSSEQVQGAEEDETEVQYSVFDETTEGSDSRYEYSLHPGLETREVQESQDDGTEVQYSVAETESTEGGDSRYQFSWHQGVETLADENEAEGEGQIVSADSKQEKSESDDYKSENESEMEVWSKSEPTIGEQAEVQTTLYSEAPDPQDRSTDFQVIEPMSVVLETGDESIKAPTHSPLSSSTSFLPDCEKEEKRSFFFSFMADYPWLFVVIVPVAFALLIYFGWSVDDKVEEHIDRLWIPEEGSYANDQRYADSFGVGDEKGTLLPGMAISRDEGNIMTEERLEAIRTRMEEVEATKIEYKGVTYTWDDICRENVAPYEFPCLRLSPMDLFKESRWAFSKEERSYFYNNFIRDLLISPRLPRFGILRSECSEECAFVIAYRTDPESVGYPADVASPLSLLADVGNLEYNDPCRICIEDKYTAEIEEWHETATSSFSYLQEHVLRARDALNDTTVNQDERMQLEDIATNLGKLAESVTTDDVADFYIYYVARGLYGDLGVESYLETYSAFGEYIDQCLAFGNFLGLTCPPTLEEVDVETAKQHLLNHADNAFSSNVTSGAPMPFWKNADGTGPLLQADENGKLHPVSGSGVNMSAPLDSLSSYMGYLYLQNEFVDINSSQWMDLVEANPLYSWFMASLSPAPSGTMCGNGNLTGTDIGSEELDSTSGELLANNTAHWCTEFSVPNPTNRGTGGYSKQHFARMWYDLLFDSILEIVQGEADPYSWTTGAGCGYELGGERFSYTGQSEKDILHNASRVIYNIDEGALLGPSDLSLMIGGVTPAVGEYDYENPITKVKALQSLYPSLGSGDIVKRVANCKRPGGAVNITYKDAQNILTEWKEAMENSWNKGWDNETDGEIQFVSYFGEGGDAIGSTGRMLEEITLSNNRLTVIAIVIIGVFSILFLFSLDAIESRVLIMVVGIGLVVLAYYAAVGLALVIGIKMNVSIAWTLPFVMLGLGVDDFYIILLAIKKQGGYSRHHWLKAMKEVAVPVTMTSVVNAAIFAIMNVSDIPAVYETSRVACFCTISLYISALFCFPAFCYLDLKRQKAGRMDVIFCMKSSRPPTEPKKEDFRNKYLYDKFYKPIVLSGNAKVRSFMHAVIFLVSAVVFAVGAWGVTEHDVGIGLEDFFPSDYPAGRWAEVRTQELASWSISMNWGALNYTNPDTQMKMIKQFEEVVASPFVTEVDTKQLWLADISIWTSRHCDENFDRAEFHKRKCGRDQLFEEDSTYCAGTWFPNDFDLREKNIQDITHDTCAVYEGGICRPGHHMHIDDLRDIGLNETSAQGQSFCPVIQGWSGDKWKFCLRQWRNITGASDRFVLEDEKGSPTKCSGVFNSDEEFVWPVPFSEGPTMFAVNMYSHQDTLDMILATRSVCDDDEELHCWMSGVPYDFWSQYDGIFEVLLTMAAYAVAAGFGIAAIFLFGKLYHDSDHPMGKIITGSLIGATLIGITIILSLVTVTGLSILAGVSVTGFSTMSFILSVGFTVEYSVHIVARWMRASMSHTKSLDRVDYTMSFLVLPTFMSFVSSTIGVACLAFTDFQFNVVYFFRPLMIVMFVSYWFGCWLLPALLVYLDFDVVKLGKTVRNQETTKDGGEHTITHGDTENLDESAATPLPLPLNQSSTPANASDQNHGLDDFAGLLRDYLVRRVSEKPDPPAGPTVRVPAGPTVRVFA